MVASLTVFIRPVDRPVGVLSIGAEAEAEARRRFDGAWQTVRTTADLEATVASIAQRAFWDALAEQVGAFARIRVSDTVFAACSVPSVDFACTATLARAPRGRLTYRRFLNHPLPTRIRCPACSQVNEGKYEALFSVLGEMQQAMTALVAHSPRLVEELNDCFDAEWLKQQADHGALEVGSVHRLMRYLGALPLLHAVAFPLLHLREYICSRCGVSRRLPCHLPITLSNMLTASLIALACLKCLLLRFSSHQRLPLENGRRLQTKPRQGRGSRLRNLRFAPVHTWS